MTTFISYKREFYDLLTHIIGSEEAHTKWLNTLSYLENCGAKKIAGAEHPTLVPSEMIKHAAEEFRHAHHLKRQMDKLGENTLTTYASSDVLGGKVTYHYLHRLEYQACRLLQKQVICQEELQQIAYPLVTYVIEQRADELYFLYEALLRKARSPVSVRSIALEEMNHLEEMREKLLKLPSGEQYAHELMTVEGTLCSKWIYALSADIKGLQEKKG